MKIRVLLNLGRDMPHPFKHGEVHDVSNEEGEMLVRNHLAEEIPETDEVELTPLAESPVVADKFQQIRQHPDHITQKQNPPRRRGNKKHE